MKHITLITDMKDVGIEEVKRQVVKDNLGPIFFNVVATEQFSIIHGAFMLRLMAELAENGDIFICVLDPRIAGKRRDSLAILTQRKNFHIFGPNNGVFSWVIKDFGVKRAVELAVTDQNEKFPTFNGKYKFAPAVHKLLSGKPFHKLGKRFHKNLLFQENLKTGTVVHIDNFGNLKIYGKRLDLDVGTKLAVSFGNETYESVFVRDFDQADENELVVYNGSSLGGLPEVAIVRGNAAKLINAKIGDKLKISTLSRKEII